MDIQHETDDTGGAFSIERDDEVLAELTYSREGDTLVVRHTLVDEKLEGQGVGSKLVAAVVEHARAKGLRVRPVCSFARAVFDKTPAYGDVLEAKKKKKET